MSRVSLINVAFISIVLLAVVLMFAIANANRNYNQNLELFQEILADGSIDNYFTDDSVVIPSDIISNEDDTVLQALCVDCEGSIANLHNSDSQLVKEAPEDVCDLTIERCLVYRYDPFGLGLFETEEILRSQR